MPIIAYTGAPGHGKTYEVVEHVILPTLAKGVDVVTNVAGLKYDEICTYIRSANPDVTKIGSIKVFGLTEFQKPNFFPSSDNSNTIVQPGDRLVVDEVWRYAGKGKKLDPRFETFLREHRHFIHPVTGECCQIDFITQSFNDFQTGVRDLIEKSFLCHSHKNLGLNKHYNIKCYTGNRQSRVNYVSDAPLRKYRPEIYNLYSSYSKGGGKSGVDVTVDKRGTLWSMPMIRYGIPAAIIILLILPFVGYYVVQRLKNNGKPVTDVVKSSDQTKLTTAVNQSSPLQAKSDLPKHLLAVIGSGSSVSCVIRDVDGGLFIFTPDTLRESATGGVQYGYKGDWYKLRVAYRDSSSSSLGVKR